VCDDEEQQIQYLTSLVRDWAENSGRKAVVRPFFSAEEFLFQYEDEKDYDILLLDIEMGNINGVELAKRIREENDGVQIVFITGYPDFIAEGYEVEALHYLLKPVSGEKLNQVLNRAAENLQRKGRVIFLRTAKEVQRIPVDSIVYVEVLSHKLMVHTLHNVYEVKLPITTMEEMLGEGFVRCHRSFLAGIAFIDCITKDSVVFDDGSTIPLARSAYGEVNRAFINYYKGELG
ncbi:MAG: response regulator transcription factor, partial [Lachnospiraceae bacterium]|nr:response regulator transcription factor [Lachnospiraceae bacterium]